MIFNKAKLNVGVTFGLVKSHQPDFQECGYVGGSLGPVDSLPWLYYIGFLPQFYWGDTLGKDQSSMCSHKTAPPTPTILPPPQKKNTAS